jgi:hypothetical protein
MVTLFASIVGFISSIFPELLKIFRDKNDKAHEIKILEKQIEMQEKGINARLDEIGLSYDVANTRTIYRTYKTGINWVDSLNGTVRPVIAYSFFILYGLVKFMQISTITGNAPAFIYLDILWAEEDHAIFAGIISFYYGQRSMGKYRHKK